jgi:hypothetical protein
MASKSDGHRHIYGSSIPGATKAYRKVDFESFSMQMHVLFRLNLSKIVICCVV